MNLFDKMLMLIKKVLRPVVTTKIPKSISDQFISMDQNGLNLIEESLNTNFFNRAHHEWFDELYLSSDQYRVDLQDHLHGRLNNFRKAVIPWLIDAKPIRGAKILEIGCGTGCSTVALAEQGAVVTAVDILESSIQVARDRCKAYNLNVNFHCANSIELHKIFSGQRFDLIIFFATLEHMTHDERMLAMRRTWDMLPTGSLWCVIDTPNRLWYYDGHTSQLPFYQWLPDDLAFLYSQFSPRKGFCNLYRELNEHSKLDFLRLGRGVSFHEFELTMKRADQFDIVSSLPIFLESRRPIAKVILDAIKNRKKRRFESFLMQFGPNMHRGFYQEYLNLIIRKN